MATRVPGALSESWTLNTVGPTIASLQGVDQSPRNIVVPSLDVTFSEPIDPSTFTYQDITYSKEGGANLITPDVTITELSSTEFEISNFNNLVSPIDGTYTFTVSRGRRGGPRRATSAVERLPTRGCS